MARRCSDTFRGRLGEELAFGVDSWARRTAAWPSARLVLYLLQRVSSHSLQYETGAPLTSCMPTAGVVGPLELPLRPCSAGTWQLACVERRLPPRNAPRIIRQCVSRVSDDTGDVAAGLGAPFHGGDLGDGMPSRGRNWSKWKRADGAEGVVHDLTSVS